MILLITFTISLPCHQWQVPLLLSRPKLWIPLYTLKTWKPFHLLEDKVTAHGAKTMKKWLNDCTKRFKGWLRNSLNLNPIDNLWSQMKQMVADGRRWSQMFADEASAKRGISITRVKQVALEVSRQITPTSRKSLLEKL